MKNIINVDSIDLENLYSIQKSLSSKVNQSDFDRLIDEEVKIVAGVDLAYYNLKDKEYAVCAIVVIDINSNEVVEEVTFNDLVEFPYIPGCFCFREYDIFVKTKELLKSKPYIFIFDGNGILHPRQMGLATYAGVLDSSICTFGVAKSYFKIHDVSYVMPDNISGEYTDITIFNEKLGVAYRSHKDSKPIFLSVGNNISLETVILLTKKLITKDSRIPIPTRLADILANRKRKILLNEFLN